MNLTVPHSWLKEFCKTNIPQEKIAARVSLCGPSIDRVSKDGADTLYEAEITTNRPDTFSIIGFAREICAILRTKFDEPLDEKKLVASTKKLIPKKINPSRSLSIRIEHPELCSRYVGLVIDRVKVASSPAWMQKRLLQSGQRPINTIVDITNYVMLEYGQPMHAFDVDMLTSKTTGAVEIIVRRAKNGEEFTTLDGETKQLNRSMLVIADHAGALALGGIKGGKRSGITDSTTTILLEAAHFNAVSVRKTSREVDIRTDSSSRFEKDLARELPPYAMMRAVELICQLAGGRVASRLVDCYPGKRRQTVIPFSPLEATRIIGVPISANDAAENLSRLGFGVRRAGKKFLVAVPFWREGDVENSRDCVEEVGRLSGYDTIPSEAVSGPVPLDNRDPLFAWESRTKHFLKARGWTEVMSYSFVPKALLERVGVDPESAVRVWNPLSLEFEYLRPSVVPSILETVAANEQKSDALFLFELSKAYIPKNHNALPDERLMLSGAIMAKRTEEDLFRILKGHVSELLGEWFSSAVGDVSFLPLSSSGSWVDVHGGSTVSVKGVTLGCAGIARSTIKNAFGIKMPLALFELDFSAAAPYLSTAKCFVPISKYPSAVRDIAAVIDKKYAYARIKEAIRSADALVTDVVLFDVFEDRKAVGAGHHSLAFHLTYADPTRTLTAQEVEDAHKTVRSMLKKQFGANFR